ncbi:hypothetical protein Nizo2766_0383 [Lactiplantibacillus plantarum]|nr:hypothetical protein Nizo2757_0838 [Lactiplantibacillus plantarum]KZU48503.1 hypothetical protein Nizo2766_0383 [Lactiplantibacillus plantarum]
MEFLIGFISILVVWQVLNNIKTNSELNEIKNELKRIERKINK